MINMQQIHTAESITDELKALYAEELQTERPVSYFAYSRAMTLLRCLYSDISISNLDAPLMTPDGNGGLRLVWAWNGFRVLAAIRESDNEPSYLYTKAGLVSEALDLTSENLTKLVKAGMAIASKSEDTK